MKSIYLDYAATTPVHEDVWRAMEPFAVTDFGNPSSLHGWGRKASAALEEARADVADCLGAAPGEIRFVRGGTESDNIAILGVPAALRTGVEPVPMLVSAIEHHAVIETAEHAEQTGLVTLTVAGVTPGGDLDWGGVGEALTVGPGVASCMWLNNETGILLPVARLTELAHEAGWHVHSDASQAVGKVPVSVQEVPVDLLTLTGHKIYGPKGTGVLYVRDGTPVSPQLHGGGQERTLRPGTEDVAGAVGLATALRFATERLASEATRMMSLRDRLESLMSTRVPDVRINGGDADRGPHVSSLSFAGVSDGDSLLMGLDLEGIAVSGGSACASGTGQGSHVIAALYGTDDALATVRFSFGLTTTDDDIDRAVEATARVVGRVRAS